MTQIINLESRYQIVRTTRDKLLKARVVILAVPWASLTAISFRPPLWPPLVERAKNHDPFTICFTVTYTHSVWRQLSDDRHGTVLNYKSRLYCYEVLGHGTPPCTLTGAIYCNNIDEMPVDAKHFVLELLVKEFGYDMLFPKQFQHVVLAQAALINFPEADARDMVIWASTNGATRFRGFLNGAVQAAMLGTAQALTILRPSVVSMNQLRQLGYTKVQPTPRTTMMERFVLSLNVMSAVRTVKLCGLGLIVYYFYRKIGSYRLKCATNQI